MQARLMVEGERSGQAFFIFHCAHSPASETSEIQPNHAFSSGKEWKGYSKIHIVERYSSILQYVLSLCAERLSRGSDARKCAKLSSFSKFSHLLFHLGRSERCDSRSLREDILYIN